MGGWKGADAGPSRHPGPYRGSGASKIAAIGVRIDAQGITKHGFALNINTDKKYWSGIIACRLENNQVANLSDVLNPLPTTRQVADVVTTAFGEIFGFEMVTTTAETV